MYKMYSKDDCPWCVKAKDLLNNVGVEFKELKLGVDYQKEDLRELLGDNLPLTVPQVYINDKRIGGYEDLAEYLESHGLMGLQN